MHTLEPRLVHPYVWVLTELLGLSIPAISDRLEISRGILDRAMDGRPPSEDILRKLAKLISQTTQEIGAQRSPPPPKNNARLPIPYRFWYIHEKLATHRRRTFDLINWILASYGPSKPSYRDTELSEQILQLLGPRGEWRSKVLAGLRAFHKKSSVRRAAERIGVREEMRGGRCWWKAPPRDIVPLKAPPLPILPASPKTSPKTYKVQRALETFLARFDQGVSAAEAIAHVVEKTSCTPGGVYKAARDLCIMRETTGFGASKRTLWLLPPGEATMARERQKPVVVEDSATVDAWLTGVLAQTMPEERVFELADARSIRPLAVKESSIRLGVVKQRNSEGRRVWSLPSETT